jgi:hypothetical protein
VYGMVNRAIEGMVSRDHGEETWREIARRAETDELVFVSNRSYDDAITYALVGAAAEVLGLPVRDVLFSFGRFWVLTTAREGYGALLDATGATLPAFLRGLPTFHTRVSLALPALRPPTFSVIDESETHVRLRYESERPGLAPFVEGLLDGLAEHYGTQVRVVHEANAGEAGHDVFLVAWGPRGLS